MVSPAVISATTQARSQWKGRQVSASVTSPEAAATTVQRVLSCAAASPSGCRRHRAVSSSAAVQTPPGRARSRMFSRKRPLVFSLLGCRARMKEGAPMVSVLMRVS